jgi:two-component system, LytTR family, response regulator
MSGYLENSNLAPFTDERFHTALALAKSHIEGGRVKEANEQLKVLLESYQRRVTEAQAADRPRYLEKLIIKSGGRVLFLMVREIDWIEAADYYVQLHVGGKTHLLRETVTSLETQLDPAVFPRIHRSTLVNIERVMEMTPGRHGNYQLILCDGTVLNLSRRRRAKLHSVFNRLF